MEWKLGILLEILSVAGLDGSLVDGSYNFNASFGPSSPYDYLTVTGTVTVDPAGGILSVSNLTENSLSVSPVDFTASGTFIVLDTILGL